MPSTSDLKLRPILSYRAEQTLQRIHAKMRFLEVAHRILNGGKHA